jgi:hypothetical protein
MEEEEKAKYKNISKFAFPPSYRRTTQITYKYCYIQVLQNLSATSGSLGPSAFCVHIVTYCLEALAFNLQHLLK